MISTKRRFKSVKINRRPYYRRRNSRSNFWKKFFLLFFLFIVIPLFFAGIRFYENIIKELPSLSKLEDISFAQTTTITDKNWEVLYKLFEENRKYVSFDMISKDTINAVIATEDKNFWTNPWVDIVWIMRAWVYDLTNVGSSVHWGSTLTQQLIKNLLLTKDKTIERKLKEIVLSIELSNYIKWQLKSKYNNISSQDLDKMVKEKILELYLNYIPFSNNAYWIEAAASTYFGTSSQNLDLLQSIIIAWIPNAPTRYNPYTNRDNLMWAINITNSEWSEEILTWWLKDVVIEKISTTMKNSTFSFNKDANDFIKYLRWLLTFQITFEWKSYNVEYIPGRKDIVMWRMFEESYIDQSQIKDIFIKSLDYKFNKYSWDIKAPHFVFWIIDSLKETYWEELLMKWWLTITTSLDMNIQSLAQESINENMDYIRWKWWNNSAMIYLDSKSWDILAYIWSQDYNNEEIAGKVDMIQALRQPGSTIKPLLYSLAMITQPITLDTPIYDIPITIWENKPENVDWEFLWLMPVKRALAYSRNIPAIKMYFLVGQESAFRKFLKSIWVNSLSTSIDYWYPMAIWACELKIIELANAYAHLSALGQPAVINPILEIRWPDWALIYKRKDETQKQIIPSGIAYMIWKILADKTNLPDSWVRNYTYDWFDTAAKSWTTNLILSNWKKLPRDGWLATYTPSKVAVFWAWNTKWEPLNQDAYWGWLNSAARKSFFKKLQERWYIQWESMEQKETTTVSISKISGKLATLDTPLLFIENALWYIENLPTQEDTSVRKIQIDWLCNWKVSDLTPVNDIKESYLITPETILPDWRDLDDIKKWWSENWITTFSEKLWKPILLEEPQTECEEREIFSQEGWIQAEILKPSEESQIARNFSIWFKIKSPFKIKNVSISISALELATFTYNKQEVFDIKELQVPEFLSTWPYSIVINAEDEKGYTTTIKHQVTLVNEDNNPPYLVQENTTVKKTDEGKYNITLMFQDAESYILKGNIYQDWKIIKSFKDKKDRYVVNFETDNLENLEYEIYDYYWNKTKESLIINQ